MRHAGGRPTKYEPRFIDEVDNYLHTLNSTEVPLKEDFAYKLGVADDTLDNWAQKNPEFLGALKKIMQKQKIQLINDGIYGGKEVNPTITKLLLQNNHGMKERTDVTTKDEKVEVPTIFIPEEKD